MNLPTDSNEKPMKRKREATKASTEGRFMHELNLLKLEGLLFCFDPKVAKQRGGKLSLKDARKQPVTIDVNPTYGQPSVTAYKVEQAALYKVASQGCSIADDGTCKFADKIYFGARELARLTNRKWGSSASEDLYQSIMQLRYTGINAELFNTDVEGWKFANFNVFSGADFSGSGDTLSGVLIELHPKIIASLNKWHVAFFNLGRLQQLEPIGIALYKNICFNFSKLMTGRRGRPNVTYRKAYAATCSEWLGGLKPARYKADIKKQLQRHFDDIKATGLIDRDPEIEKNADGSGFNLVYHAGPAFFDDYEAYYLKFPKPRVEAQSAELDEVKALALVAHFHRSLGHDHNKFSDSEISYAKELLARHNEADLRDLIAYAVAEAGKTSFPMRLLNAVKGYVSEWEGSRKRSRERRLQTAAIQACRLCNDAGMLLLRRRSTGELVVHPCRHEPGYTSQVEEKLQADRL